MTICYDPQVIEDLRYVEPLQARMLLDYFENQYEKSKSIHPKGKVFDTGAFRILYKQNEDKITVLRIIQ